MKIANDTGMKEPSAKSKMIAVLLAAGLFPWVGGNYSSAAEAANALGAVGFLAAALFFSRRYLRQWKMEDLAFAGQTLLFGPAGCCLGFSHVWAADWWVWHGLRLLAYALLLVIACKLVVTAMSEITKRKRAQEALRASEVRYRRLFEAAKDGVLILDSETGTVVDVNPFLAQLLGLSREAFLGKQIWELGFFKEIVADRASFELFRQEAYIRYDNRPLEAADGRRIEVEFVSTVHQGNHRKVVQCNVRDITERKRNEEQARIHRAQLRALSRRLEKLREEERTRISREIHDELGQMLTGIKMDLRWMERHLDEFGNDRRVNPILDKLVATAELADATVKTVQRIAADLRPGILDKLGLPTALQYEAARFEQRTGIPCRLVMPGDTIPLRSEAATAFFRIFQEALTNVTRHARAKAVEVELRLETDGCRLEIRDDGQGMAGVELARLTSLGLLGMQERARLLGGDVTFGPRPGGGTVVTVRIPNIPASEHSV